MRTGPGGGEQAAQIEADALRICRCVPIQSVACQCLDPVEKGEISSRWDLAAVDETDLLGRTTPESITADGKAFRFSARPFEIKTFRLALA